MELKSALMRDQPMKPMDKALYWVEYVLKYNGASHYRSSALDLTWYQYLMIDVFAFEILLIYTIYFTIKTFFKLLFKQRSNVTIRKKKN